MNTSCKCSICKQNLQLMDEFLEDSKFVTDQDNSLICVYCYQNRYDQDVYS